MRIAAANYDDGSGPTYMLAPHRCAKVTIHRKAEVKTNNARSIELVS
jgi:hypothetical protein